MSKLLEFLGIVVLTIGYIFYRLFALSKIWGYIGVKTFHLPSLGLWQLFAVSFLLGSFKSYEWKKHENKSMSQASKEFFYAYAYMSFSWFFAWLLF